MSIAKQPDKVEALLEASSSRLKQTTINLGVDDKIVSSRSKEVARYV